VSFVRFSTQNSSTHTSCPNRVFEIRAASHDEAEDWVKSIRSWLDVEAPVPTTVLTNAEALKLNSWRALEK
jgi:hypothetical protein